MKKRIVLALVLGLILALAMGIPALADGGPNPHTHILTTPGGDVGVGPDPCNNPTHGAYHNFHNNVHHGAPGLDGDGPVDIGLDNWCPQG